MARSAPFRSASGKMAAALFDPGVSPDLETSLVGIVQEEQRDFVVSAKVADAHILAVSTQVQERQRLVVEHLQEAALSTSELNVRPTI